MLTRLVIRNFKRFGEVEIDPEVGEKLDAIAWVAEAAATARDRGLKR